MGLQRRDFLAFLGVAAGSAVFSPWVKRIGESSGLATPTAQAQTNVGMGGGANSSARLPRPAAIGFKPVSGPLPVPTDGIAPQQQATQLATFAIQDDLVLPEGYQYDLIGAWGDRLGDSRFGYNNDYLSFVETNPGEGFLTINFEYISAVPWQQTYQEVIAKDLPLKPVQEAVKANKSIDAYTLPEGLLKTQVKQVCSEALIDQGLGVISIRRNAKGGWERTYSKADRRVTGISGLTDGRYLKTTGPAKAVFTKKQGQGYLDKLGDRIIGSFGNCAGGTTPWGTTLSGEENIQSQVPEAVYADGTSFPPGDRPFSIDEEELSGQGNVFGLAGNKYGWIVEIDPANPNDFGTKHTWMGRFRHEAVGVRAEAGKRLAFYSGCDRRGGHIYKFVSKGQIKKPQDKANSKLLETGMLYAAVFNPDGSGKWIPLQASTPVAPQMPSQLVGGMINLPDRPKGGYKAVKTDDEVKAFEQQYKTLGDLYSGSPEEQQGAILVDAHYAANACGATCTARPEDTEIAPNGSLYIAFTSGAPSGSDGGPDQRIFKGPKGEVPYEYGFIVNLIEDKNDPAAMTFRWKMLALGGEPSEGGAGFANPDNLMLDVKGNVWVVVDMSSDRVNKAIPSRLDKEGKPVGQSSLRGLFGNNSMWMIPTNGPGAGQAYRFATGPMECELTGPFLSRDAKAMFLSVQHPGEVNGARMADRAEETRMFAMKTTQGQAFVQERRVPIGSNWPSKIVGKAPRPGVVVIRRKDGKAIS
jgi:uncharacterized protein